MAPTNLYPSRLRASGVDVLVPHEDERADVHGIIYDELLHGELRDESRKRCLEVIDSLVGRGAEPVLLACTEIALLVQDGDASVPLLDTTSLHCRALADVIINGVNP